MKTALKQTAFAGLMTLFATAALAHSTLEVTQPANGASVAGTPAAVTLQFKSDMRLTRVSMTHADAHTADLDLAGLASFTTEFAVPLQDMGAGVYLIEWRGLGTDGHVLTGSFSFTVQ